MGCLLVLSFFTLLESFLLSLLTDALRFSKLGESGSLGCGWLLLRCGIEEARSGDSMVGHLRAKSASCLNKLIQA